MGIEYREKIISLCKQKGPILPNDVAKMLKTETWKAGAMLSEMTENKILLISAIKIGGSPLYYLPEHQEKLELFVNRLNDKDKKVFDFIKQRKILRDSELDLLTRFSLRQLKDFARPLHVTKGEDAELFWRFYSVSEEQAIEILHPKPKIQQTQTESLKQKLEQPKIFEPAKKRGKKGLPGDDALFQKAKAYLEAKGFSIREFTIITKKKDVELIAEKQSMQFFCKILGKKNISDTDIAAAYGKASAKKLQAMLLITGKISKKAQASLSSFTNLSVEMIS